MRILTAIAGSLPSAVFAKVTLALLTMCCITQASWRRIGLGPHPGFYGGR